MSFSLTNHLVLCQSIHHELKSSFTKQPSATVSPAGRATGNHPLSLLEITVRLFGWGLPRESYDPYLGFESVQPLFVVNGARIATRLQKVASIFFSPITFATSKESSTYRIFCLGGSTVQGRPYALETAFSSWLELSLQSAAPQRSMGSH